MKNILVLLFVLLSSSVAQAVSGWSWNLGYHNPPGSTAGLSFMHMWSKWAFEIGVGYLTVEDKDDTDNDGNSTEKIAAVAGDLDMKYLFGSGGFRPYVQAGTGYGVGAGNKSVGLGIGGSVYGGLGFFAMGSSAYGYVSFNTGSFMQAGIGFDF